MNTEYFQKDVNEAENIHFIFLSRHEEKKKSRTTI